MKQVITFILFSLFCYTSSAQGKLNDAKNEMKENKMLKDAEINRRRSTSTSQSYDESSIESSLTDAIAKEIVKGMLFITYNLFITSPWEESDKDYRYMSASPYFHDKIGNYHHNLDYSKKHRIDIGLNMVAQNQELYGSSFSLKYHPINQLNIDFSYLHLYEKLPNNRFDLLKTMTLLANYQRFRFKHFNLNWGIGATYVGFEVEQWGVAIGAQAELFFLKPLSANLKFTSSYINLATVTTSNLELRYHSKKHFFSAGYHHFKFGRVQIPTAAIGYGLYL